MPGGETDLRGPHIGGRDFAVRHFQRTSREQPRIRRLAGSSPRCYLGGVVLVKGVVAERLRFRCGD